LEKHAAFVAALLVTPAWQVMATMELAMLELSS
jgi:hypothetical protein